MSSQTTATNRGCAWSDEEVKALLAVWGEGDIQEQLDGAVRNKTVFENISKKLSELGHDRDWQQCRVKTKNLKKNYRDVKDHNAETGRGRKTCKFFKELDAILGHRPASVPSVLLDTGSTSQSATAPIQANDSSAEEEANEGDDIPATTPLDTALDSGDPSSSRDVGTRSEPVDDAAGPPRKKRRTEKRGKMERALDYALNSYAKHHQEDDERYRKYEEERWEKQMELEEKRRREDMEHEERMMRMMARVFQRPSPYDFNAEEYRYDSQY